MNAPVKLPEYGNTVQICKMDNNNFEDKALFSVPKNNHNCHLSGGLCNQKIFLPLKKE